MLLKLNYCVYLATVFLNSGDLKPDVEADVIHVQGIAAARLGEG